MLLRAWIDRKLVLIRVAAVSFFKLKLELKLKPELSAHSRSSSLISNNREAMTDVKLQHPMVHLPA